MPSNKGTAGTCKATLTFKYKNRTEVEGPKGATYLEGRLEDDNIAGTLDPGLSVHLNGHVGVQVYLDVSTLWNGFQDVLITGSSFKNNLIFGAHLSYAHGRAYSGLDLTQVDHASDAHHLQHAIVVVGRGELVVLVGTPWIGAASPAVEIVNY